MTTTGVLLPRYVFVLDDGRDRMPPKVAVTPEDAADMLLDACAGVMQGSHRPAVALRDAWGAVVAFNGNGRNPWDREALTEHLRLFVDTLILAGTHPTRMPPVSVTFPGGWAMDLSCLPVHTARRTP